MGAFTMFSVATGVCTSLLGPVRDCCKLRGIKSLLKDDKRPSANHPNNRTPARADDNATHVIVDKTALRKYRPKIAVVRDYAVEHIVDGAGNVRRMLVAGAAA